jgi:outer membrane protein OmpA-like peptidoglycan-associated protein
MRKRSLSLVVAAPFMLMAALSTVASARDIPDPKFWLTPGGGIAWPPAEFGFGHDGVDDTAPTFGGILGFQVVPAVGLELRGHFLTKEELDNLDLLHGEGNLTWFLAPGRQIVPLLTGGAGVIRAENDFGDDDQFAWNVGGGFLLKLTDNVGIRLDARRVSYKVIDFLNDESFRPHTEAFAGLNLGFGGKPRDTDKDGIPNRTDACPDTPIGARVDARGCPIDGDKDGVPDGLDRCEGTPRGATVDATGCPSDADRDGIFDGLDECADTPAEAKVDSKGCGLDSDADGVFDGLDLCDATPAGCTVNAQGCPSDADGDGVCDGVDTCADTPAEVRVDSKGCPIVLTEKETELLETGMIRLQNVHFDSNKATIKPESYPVLDEVGEILGRWPELRIEIGGHCDSQGSDAHNLTLSNDRAKSVLDYLVGKFANLKAEQLTSAGYGETLPIAPNDTAFNRAKNRRVEFKVLNTEALKRETERTRLAPKN